MWNAVISYTKYAKIFWDELKLQSSNEKPNSNLPGIIDTALKNQNVSISYVQNTIQ